MLFVYPPLARSAEPPIGLARLAGALRAAGRDCACLDLCQEGFDYLLKADFPARDSFSLGAKKRRERNLALLRSPAALENRDRYDRALRDLNRCVREAGRERSLVLSLTDYQDPALSPLRRRDLLSAARAYRDNIFYPLFEERIPPALAGRRTLGLSLCFLSQALPAFALLGYVRDSFPGTRIILGGSLVGSWAGQGRIAAGETFDGLVDEVVTGRGEEALLGEGRGFGRGRGEAVPPDFSDFEGLGYLSPRRVLPYNFSSGCAWRRCRFCPERAERRPYAAIRPEVAMREIEILVERHGPEFLHFTDSEIGEPFLEALAGRPPGVPWYGFARFRGHLTDPVFCRRLADSGCAMLQLGLESGDQGVLDALDKGTKVADIEKALACLKEAGIGVFAYLLFGTAAENRASAGRTLAFAEANAGMIDFLNVAIFNLPAASPEAIELGARDFSPADLSLYGEFSHPEGWNRDEVRSFIDGEFSSSPALRPILHRSPPFLTSNHAAFFL